MMSCIDAGDLRINKTIVSRVLVPTKLFDQVRSEAHDSPSGGHFGDNKTDDDSSTILLDLL